MLSLVMFINSTMSRRTLVISVNLITFVFGAIKNVALGEVKAASKFVESNAFL